MVRGIQIPAVIPRVGHDAGVHILIGNRFGDGNRERKRPRICLQPGGMRLKAHGGTEKQKAGYGEMTFRPVALPDWTGAGSLSAQESEGYSRLIPPPLPNEAE